MQRAVVMGAETFRKSAVTVSGRRTNLILIDGVLRLGAIFRPYHYWVF